jgi:hypothetical protein
MADGSGGGDDGGRDWRRYPSPEELGIYMLTRHRVPRLACHYECWRDWSTHEPNSRVAESTVRHFRVSTVFLGRDMGFGRDETGIFFETMTFVDQADESHGPRHGMQHRCSTWLEAEAQHAREVKVAHEFTYPERYKPKPNVDVPQWPPGYFGSEDPT